MVLTDSGMMAAFQSASGVSPSDVSIAIRTFFIALVFLWAGWACLGFFHALDENKINLIDLVWRLLWVVTVIVVCIAIAYEG